MSFARGMKNPAATTDKRTAARPYLMDAKPTRSNLIRALLLPVVVLALGTGDVRAERGNFHRFKLTLQFRLTTETKGEKKQVFAESEFRYNWIRDGRVRRLTVDSLLIKSSTDGKVTVNQFMDRGKLIDFQLGQTNLVGTTNLPARTKQKLQDTFGPILCTLQVDEQGREIKRTVIAGPGAKDSLDNGLIANTLLFHPPFLNGDSPWSAPQEISMGQGRYAQGKLTYQKQAGGLTTTCKVSGILRNDDDDRWGGLVTIRNARYVVNGEQMFNPQLKEWVYGRLEMDVSYQVLVGGEPSGSAQGVITASFERITPKP